MIDLIPSYDDNTDKWAVTENDHQGNTLDVFRFATLSEALDYVADRLDAHNEKEGYRNAEPPVIGED